MVTSQSVLGINNWPTKKEGKQASLPQTKHYRTCLSWAYGQGLCQSPSLEFYSWVLFPFGIHDQCREHLCKVRAQGQRDRGTEGCVCQKINTKKWLGFFLFWSLFAYSTKIRSEQWLVYYLNFYREELNCILRFWLSLCHINCFHWKITIWLWYWGVEALPSDYLLCLANQLVFP